MPRHYNPTVSCSERRLSPPQRQMSTPPRVPNAVPPQDLSMIDAPPAGVDDSYTASNAGPLRIAPPQGVLSNDSWSGENSWYRPLRAELASGPATGQLHLLPDGSFQYLSANSVPSINDDTAVTPGGTEIILDVAANDAYTAGNTGPVTFDYAAVQNGLYDLTNQTVTIDVQPGLMAAGVQVISVTQPINGSAVLNPDNTITYTPNPGFTGSDSFTYEGGDEIFGTETGTVTIDVQAPTAVRLGQMSTSTLSVSQDKLILIFCILLAVTTAIVGLRKVAFPLFVRKSE